MVRRRARIRLTAARKETTLACAGRALFTLARKMPHQRGHDRFGSLYDVRLPCQWPISGLLGTERQLPHPSGASTAHLVPLRTQIIREREKKAKKVSPTKVHMARNAIAGTSGSPKPPKRRHDRLASKVNSQDAEHRALTRSHVWRRQSLASFSLVPPTSYPLLRPLPPVSRRATRPPDATG